MVIDLSSAPCATLRGDEGDRRRPGATAGAARPQRRARQPVSAPLLRDAGALARRRRPGGAARRADRGLARHRHRQGRAAGRADRRGLRGHFYIPTVAQAARAKHLARRPGVSVTYYEGRSTAVIVHGQATAVPRGEDPFDEVEGIRLAAGGQSLLEWSGDPIFIRVDPDVIYTYAA
jgi:hypothetical protein